MDTVLPSSCIKCCLIHLHYMNHFCKTLFFLVWSVANSSKFVSGLNTYYKRKTHRVSENQLITSQLNNTSEHLLCAQSRASYRGCKWWINLLATLSCVFEYLILFCWKLDTFTNSGNSENQIFPPSSMLLLLLLFVCLVTNSLRSLFFHHM